MSSNNNSNSSNNSGSKNVKCKKPLTDSQEGELEYEKNESENPIDIKFEYHDMPGVIHMPEDAVEASFASLNYLLEIVQQDPRMLKLLSIHCPGIKVLYNRAKQDKKHTAKEVISHGLGFVFGIENIPVLGAFVHCGWGVKYAGDIFKLESAKKATTKSEDANEQALREEMCRKQQLGLFIDFVVEEGKFFLSIAVDAGADAAAFAGLGPSALPVSFFARKPLEMILKATINAAGSAALAVGSAASHNTLSSIEPGFMVALLRYVCMPVKKWERDLINLKTAEEQINYLKNNMITSKETLKEYDNVAEIIAEYSRFVPAEEFRKLNLDLDLPFDQLTQQQQKSLRKLIISKQREHSEASKKEQAEMKAALANLQKKNTPITEQQKLKNVMSSETFNSFCAVYANVLPKSKGDRKDLTFGDLAVIDPPLVDFAKTWAIKKYLPGSQCETRIKLRRMLGLKEAEDHLSERELCSRKKMRLAKNLLYEPQPWEGGYHEWVAAVKAAAETDTPLTMPYIYFLLFIYRVYYKIGLGNSIKALYDQEKGLGFKWVKGFFRILGGRFQYDGRGLGPLPSGSRMELSSSLPAGNLHDMDVLDEDELNNFFAPETYRAFMRMPCDEFLDMYFGNRVPLAAREARTAGLRECYVVTVEDLLCLSEKKMEAHKIPTGLRLVVRDLQELDLVRSMFFLGSSALHVPASAPIKNPLSATPFSAMKKTLAWKTASGYC
mmetsp:Transcript_25694/g.64519  ORF Transcript_25694/g.64519 Transcript_25694/m.64519 type:complete len:724 (-) Transcript_25694:158-2329(-)|eukprot:CAMPEP_0177647274 /NCGR_PEP_ID=MMETSP0447-20121125/10213_1 /TAXON_ID=0 /ORGANISM="Stygamoeba regulata, Strain BSH-02190019" /LENGTH=723 /DNA_ID=CAMNT_0019149849 /DNA_START=285 /DNA_END=2456 /DNA_ORIENTATION=+